MSDISGTSHYASLRAERHLRVARTPVGLEEATKGLEVVYYIELERDIIKIGTSTNLAQRIRKHGFSLLRNEGRLLAVEFGSRELEHQRHEQFSDVRIGKTELFHVSPALRDHVMALRTELGISA
jgi:hypothetical protein